MWHHIQMKHLPSIKHTRCNNQGHLWVNWWGQLALSEELLKTNVSENVNIVMTLEIGQRNECGCAYHQLIHGGKLRRVCAKCILYYTTLKCVQCQVTIRLIWWGKRGKPAVLRFDWERSESKRKCVTITSGVSSQTKSSLYWENRRTQRRFSIS